MHTALNLLFRLADFLLFGALGRRRARRVAREAQRAAATGLLNKEYSRISRLRSFRRALHLSSVWKSINEHPRTRLLPRSVRRQATRNAAHYAYRAERGLPAPDSKSHRRRLLRGYFDAALVLPVKSEDIAATS